MAGNSDNTLTVLDSSRISPATTVSQASSYRLSFFDLQWITSPPVQQLCFYEYPNNNNPKSDFFKTIVPTLKHSLSITLGHFLPLSGSLILFPYSSGKKPEIRCVEGDSVSLLVTESTKEDFTNLIGNHSRDANEFYLLVPHLGQISNDENSKKLPLLAVQVTLFPESGICMGITTHHAACDGNARVRFLKAWTSIAKFGDDKSFVERGFLPFLDRSVIKDPYHMEEKIWSMLGPYAFEIPQHLFEPNETVRATFLMTRTLINKLKETILLRRPMLAHVSTFTIVYAYVWTCMARVRASTSGEADKGENELEQVIFTADYRARLDPPIPATYFGNCVWALFAKVKRGQFLGEDGFLNAVQVIGDAIYQRFSNKENSCGDEEKWKELDLSLQTTLGVAGSPKFNTYGMDFGWGKPRKCEIISTDHSGAMSLSVSKDSEEDIEVGLSLPKMQMEAFFTIFNNGLIKT